MRNIEYWRQGTFIGGKNSTTPSTEMESNELQDCLNFFPNKDGSELELRSPFILNDWTSAHTHVSTMSLESMLSSDGGSPANLTILDGTLSAVVTGGHLHVYAHIPEGAIPARSLITDEHIWTSAGNTLPAGYYGYTPPASVSAWAAHLVGFANLTNKSFVPAGGATDSFLCGLKDYWVNDTATFDGSLEHIAPLNNNSLWVGDADIFVSDVTTSTFLTAWIDSADTDTKYMFDTWYDSASTRRVATLASDQFKIASPWWLENEAISGTTAVTNPTAKFPTLQFNVVLPEPNVDLYFKFGYAEGLTGARANVYVKDASNPLATWDCVNVKSTVVTPITCVLQSTIDAGLRWEGTGVLTGTIACGKKLNYSNVAVKIEFFQSATDTDNLDVGGIFLDCFVGTP